MLQSTKLNTHSVIVAQSSTGVVLDLTPLACLGLTPLASSGVGLGLSSGVGVVLSSGLSSGLLSSGVGVLTPLGLAGAAGLGRRMQHKVQVFSVLNQHLVVYPTPASLNWGWNWGSMSGLMLSAVLS